MRTIVGAWCGVIGATLALTGGMAPAADLLDAYRQALANDANFLAARAGAEAAREALPQARANFLPNVSANASRSKNNTDITQNTLLGRSTSQFDYIAEGQNLTLRQPLVRLGSIAQYRQSEAQVASAEATLEKERQAVGLRVAGAYFDVLAARDQLRFIAEQKKMLYEQWQRAGAMLRKGAGTRTDQDEAQARYDAAVAQEIDAANALDLAERTLAAITNTPVPAASLSPLDERRLPLEPPLPARFDDWVKLAENSNPELIALRYAIDVAIREVDKQRSGHYPTMDLIAQQSFSASETVSIIGSRYNTRLIGLQVSIPLFAGGAVLSAERQALANVERARQQYDAGRRQLVINLRREFSNVIQGIAKIGALGQSLRSAEQALRSTEMGVIAGTRNNLDVLNARGQLYSAQRELAKARYDYVVARLKLKGASGTLGDADLDLVNGWLTAAK